MSQLNFAVIYSMKSLQSVVVTPCVGGIALLFCISRKGWHKEKSICRPYRCITFDCTYEKVWRRDDTVWGLLPLCCVLPERSLC